MGLKFDKEWYQKRWMKTLRKFDDAVLSVSVSEYLNVILCKTLIKQTIEQGKSVQSTVCSMNI